MIDFKQKMSQSFQEKKTDPIQIYDDLDRISTAGPLRNAQKDVLKEWYETKKSDKDLVIKLHTGEGKTLIGLLILLSKLNMNEGPCAYICPNKYLVNQVCKEAIKFGIPVCTIGTNNQIPNEFSSGNRILVTHAQKLFNGKTIFGLANSFEKIGTIILDDAHACLDSIREAFIVSIKRKDNSEIYDKIIELFEEDLNEQGEGTFWDIKNNTNYESIMMIPYWSWIEKKSELLEILAPHSNETFLVFAWNLIKNGLDKCQAFVNGGEIQIMPLSVPIEMFGSFANANNRILMSATTQDDIYFVKTLDFSIESIKNPIISKEHMWSGEKMILIPSLVSDKLNREDILDYFCSMEYKFGVVSLTPTTKKQDDYTKYGCAIVDTKNIFEETEKLQNGDFDKMVVFKNRYDGIDLPDNACRILIIDSMPFFTNMSDKYEEKSRIDCSLIKKKMAQKIEQGLGRCVRSEKDFSTILILGAELVSFVRCDENKELFSEQTKRQIEIGLQMAKWANEDLPKEKLNKEQLVKNIVSLVNQCLKRDDGWKGYYKSQMDLIVEKNEQDDKYYEILKLERKAEKLYTKNKYDDAIKEIQKILDRTGISNTDKGWYLQLMARYKYTLSKLESNQLQKSAFERNFELLKPKDGITYKKIQDIHSNRLQNLSDRLGEFKSYDDLMLEIDKLCENMSFGVEADKFEAAVEKVGYLLGFESQRPDKMVRKGPDNLWKVDKTSYIMFECKSEVSQSRAEIYKSEVGQMNNHCGWFESEYDDAKVLRVHIIPTNKIAYEANYTHDVRIMMKKQLICFKKNIVAFFKELKEYDISNLDINYLNTCITTHNLNIENFTDIYTVKAISSVNKI